MATYRIRTARDLGATIKGRRIDLGLSQAQVADAARVGRPWLSEVEHGKPTAEVGRVLRVLDVLSIDLVADATGVTGGRAVDLDDHLRQFQHGG